MIPPQAIHIWNALGNAMAKQPTLSRNKVPIPGYEMKDGKLVGKPPKKQSVSKHIQQRKSKRVKVVKGGQRP